MDTIERNRQTRQRAKKPRLRARIRFLRPKLRGVLKARDFDLRSKLIAMSSVSLVVVAGGAVLSSYGLLSPAATVAALLIGAALGMLVLATQANGVLDRHFAEFRSARLFAAGLFALGTYVAHGRAVVEVNGIFGEAAAAFPHAVAAASAMFVATWTLWVALVPIFVGSLICWLYFNAIAKAGGAAISLSILVATISLSSLILHQAADGERRHNNLYQIALAMDFNKRSKCVGVPADAEGVAFVGSNQMRAIVAPRLAPVPGDRRMVFREVVVPQEFVRVQCL
jgi:hypothetical protein